MCRMAFMSGLNSEYVENMRRMWIDNPHGWGLVYKDEIKDGKYVMNKSGKYKYIEKRYMGLKEWRTLNSDTPIAYEYLPKKLDGIFHIRYATVSRELGGVHPYILDVGDEKYVYSHNGVIHGLDVNKFDVDSEIIGELFYLEYNGDMHSTMVKVLKRLNSGLYDGYWNILMVNKSMEKLFVYSDGSLSIFEKKGKFYGISSDDRWDIYRDFNFIEIPPETYIYMEKIDGKWVIEDEGEIEKVIDDKYLYENWDKYLYEDEIRGWYE